MEPGSNLLKDGRCKVMCWGAVDGMGHGLATDLTVNRTVYGGHPTKRQAWTTIRRYGVRKGACSSTLG